MPEFGLLSWIIWLPVLAGAVIALLSRKAAQARWAALSVSLLQWIPGTMLWMAFTPGGDFQFVERHSWIERFNVEYYLGVDGIAVALILLTLLLTPAAVVAGWRAIDRRTGLYYGALLIQQGLMLGVFCALDSLLFYVFWEFMLAPMFLIIGIWGGRAPHIRHRQVLPVHISGLGVHAGGLDLPGTEIGQFTRFPICMSFRWRWGRSNGCSSRSWPRSR